jgi:hypothetical protein
MAKKLSNNDRIYRGCVLGMTQILIDGMHDLRYDLESCKGIATDEEIDALEDAKELLETINARVKSELKNYGLEEN